MTLKTFFILTISAFFFFIIPNPAHSQELQEQLEHATVTVHIGSSFGPISEESVRLHIVFGSHELISSLEAVTDQQGNAVFEVPIISGSRIVAETRHNGSLRFSEEIELDHEESRDLSIFIAELSNDPSVLSVRQLSTIAELWEGYILFTQIWHFQVDQPVIFSNIDGTDPQQDWIALPMPKNAEGISVLQPRNAQVIGETVYLPLTVEENRSSQPHFIVRFSLSRTDHQEALIWQQETFFDIHTSLIIANETTSFSRHERLNLAIDSPICNNSNCSFFSENTFEETIENQSILSFLREGTHFTALTTPAAFSGDNMSVTISGWPTRVPFAHYSMIFFSVLGVFIGIFFIFKPFKAQDTALILDAQRRDLHAYWAKLQSDLSSAKILEHDYELAIANLQEELGVLERRFREVNHD